MLPKTCEAPVAKSVWRPLGSWITFCLQRVSRSQLLRDLALTFGSNLVVLTTTMLVSILSARLLGVEGRGELATVMVWPLLVTSLGDMGIPYALVYYASSATVQGLCRLYTASWIIWLFQGAFLTILGQILIHHFLSHGSQTVLHAAQFYMCLVPVSLAITFHCAILLGIGHVLRYNVCRIASAVSYLVPFVTAFFLQHRRIIAILELYAVLQLAVLAVAAYLVRIRPSYASRPSKTLLFNVLRYGGKSAISNVSTFLNARLDQLALSVTVPMRELGLYVAAGSYASVLLNLSQAAASVALSHAARAGDQRSATRTVTRMLRLNLALGLPLALAAEFAAARIIPLTLGRDFTDAVPLAHVLVAAVFLLGFVYVFLDGMRGLGKPLDPAASQLSGAAAMIIGLAILMPHPSAARVATVSLGSAAISLTVAAALLHRRASALRPSSQKDAEPAALMGS